MPLATSSLDDIRTSIADPGMATYRTDNFYVYALDGPNSKSITDGGFDMFDGGNFT